MWQRRLGHTSIDNNKEELRKIKTTDRCRFCSYKMKNKSHHKVVNKTEEPFELIHVDTVSAPDPSHYSNNYLLTILDEYTRFS